MAKVYKIAELLEMVDGSLVTGAVKGKVTEVRERKKGKRDDGGEWSFQGLVIKDASGTMKVSLKDQPSTAPKSWVGKELQLVAYKGKKGWSGLKIVEETYQNKTSLSLRVTPSAEIICGGESLEGKSGGEGVQDDAPEENQESPEEADAGDAKPKQQERVADKQPEKAPVNKREAQALHITKVKAHMSRQATLLVLAAEQNLNATISFMEANGVEVNDDERAQIVTKIAHNLCNTSFTSIYLSVNNHDWDVFKGNAQGEPLNTTNIPILKVLPEVLELAKEIATKAAKK